MRRIRTRLEEEAELPVSVGTFVSDESTEPQGSSANQTQPGRRPQLPVPGHGGISRWMMSSLTL